MARSDAVWGIDIGQCALKALRCRAHEREDRIVAEAFDYIEYPKMLSQPGADPEELVGDALKQFLSRNTVRGDRVAICVSGQSGLARFIKLPPVEAKKIPDIVRYEARQQIPFDLNDVIWDYQRMGGGSEEEGFALETEIGLFAMKRDAVFRALEPFEKASIGVDYVQLTPLALYNYLLFDQLHDLPPADEYDPDNPPDSVAVLSLGTDSTDLIVTNGYRVWQRSIPLGGNHFTKALTKELKLTFAKAEHLKRNATATVDPKVIFQAMRPVFSDLLTEVQRSIGYFTSIDRAAKITRVVALGNAMKLPGLRRYLLQGLGFEVERVGEFQALSGSQVLSAPAFRDNLPSFGVCYGLALQGLGKGGLQTNLLPKEIVRDRLVRQKKPWAIAAAAVLLLACAISFAAFSSALSSVDAQKWQTAEGAAGTRATEGKQYRDGKQQAMDKFGAIKEIGDNLVGNVEGRVLWLELLRTINECLPHDPPGKRPKRIAKRNELHIRNLECQYLEDLSQWYAGVKQWYQPPEEDVEGPTGPGWVICLEGYHYHNLKEAGGLQSAQYVRETLIKNLHNAKLILPTGDRKGVESVLAKELGIGYPVLVDPQKVVEQWVTNPNEDPAPEAPEAGGGMRTATAGNTVALRRFDFVVHFCWIPTTPSERHEKTEKQETEQREEKE